MTALFVAPDGYGDPTIWRRDSDDDRLPQPILSRTAANARGFDALAALVDFDALRALVWRTLADHQWADWSCSCGQIDPDDRDYEDNHLADMIALALAQGAA